MIGLAASRLDWPNVYTRRIPVLRKKVVARAWSTRANQKIGTEKPKKLMVVVV